MDRYLLFDSGCNTCSRIAQEVEQEIDGFLVARTLRDPKMQELLGRVKPDWHWEPTLLEIDAEEIRAYTGLSLRARLLSKLGPKRAWQVAKMVSQLMMPLEATNIGRRSFLQQSSTLLFALALWPKQTTSPNTQLSANDIADSVPVEGNELAGLVERAIKSSEFRIIDLAHNVDFNNHEVKAVQNTFTNGRQEVVVTFTFTATKGDFATYVERSEGYVRSKGEYYQKVNDNGYLLTTLAINGESMNLPEGGVVTMGDQCPGCTWENRSGCRPCGSSIRPTEEQCCICTDWWGNPYVLFCSPYWEGPCGFC